jgi:hypothetical protein
MKRFNIKMVTLAVILVAGYTGLNAQNNRGNQYLRNQRGACVNSSGLTTEQKAEIQKLSVAHQSEMDALRTELRTTSDVAQRREIRGQMDQIQVNHRTKITGLGATPANTPHSGFSGRGRGAGRGAGLGAGRAAGGGRGLGPCGAGLGRSR